MDGADQRLQTIVSFGLDDVLYIYLLLNVLFLIKFQVRIYPLYTLWNIIICFFILVEARNQTIKTLVIVLLVHLLLLLQGIYFLNIQLSVYSFILYFYFVVVQDVANIESWLRQAAIPFERDLMLWFVSTHAFVLRVA